MRLARVFHGQNGRDFIIKRCTDYTRIDSRSEVTTMRHLLLVLILATLAAGCATANSSYAPTATCSENDVRNVTDEDILKAFQAQPQIQPPVKVAWYNMGSDALMASLMREDPNVALHYEIPKALVEGARPYFPSRGYYYFREPRQIDVKALRLLAARAKCDVVVLIGSRFEEELDVNAWAVFNILIVPALVTPYWNAKYHYEAEALVFDVRNGYMYKHAKSVSDEERKQITIYGLVETSKKVELECRAKGWKHLEKEIYTLFR